MKTIAILSLAVSILFASCKTESLVVSKGIMKSYFKLEHFDGYAYPNGISIKATDKWVIHTKFTPGVILPYDKHYYIEFTVPSIDAGGHMYWRYLITIPAYALSKDIPGKSIYRVTEKEAKRLTCVIVPIKNGTDLKELYGKPHFDMKYADHPIKLKPWVERNY